jgi:hypothetical protein
MVSKLSKKSRDFDYCSKAANDIRWISHLPSFRGPLGSSLRKKSAAVAKDSDCTPETFSRPWMDERTSMPSTQPAGTPANPEILSDLTGVERGHETEVVNHYNIRRIVDIYADVQDRDLGGVSRQITKILNAKAKSLPRGTYVTLKG